jgi:hypothetical protein
LSLKNWNSVSTATVTGGPHVAPPSVEVFTKIAFLKGNVSSKARLAACTRSFGPKSSHGSVTRS